MENNNINSAASKLREHAEFFYEYVCDSLKAKIDYRSDGNYTLGDYLNGAKGSYTVLINEAKKVTSSLNDIEKLNELKEEHSIFISIVERTQLEQWGINVNVHYSNWSDFSREDFKPIVEAFHDLENSFKCPNCNSIIELHKDKNMNNKCITCNCGRFFWSFKKKSNSVYD